MKWIITAITATVLSASLASASVTIISGATGIMRDSTGTMISLGSIGVLIGDVSGNGLVDPTGSTLAVGNTFGSTGGDVILGVYQAVDISVDASNKIGFDLSGTQFSYSGVVGTLAAGNSLWLAWFPSISALNATIAAGTSYGTFRTTNIDVNLGTMAWIAPPDGTNQQLYSLDAALGGDPAVAQADFTANKITAVPEPSAYGLLGLGAMVLIFFRIRARRCA